MDRKPKPAPFKVGQRVRYIGKGESYTYDIDSKTNEMRTVPLQVPGMIVTIDKVVAGRQGTLCHIRDHDGPMYYEDTGEPILDTTHDAYNVYHVEAWQHGIKQGQCIDREYAKEWKKVK